MTLRKADIPDRYAFKETYYGGVGEWINRGGSAIVDPDGKFVAGPLREQEGILYAEIDPRKMRGPKWMLDVAGHYARPDVFQLTVRRDARPMITVTETPAAGEDDRPEETGELRAGREQGTAAGAPVSDDVAFVADENRPAAEPCDPEAHVDRHREGCGCQRVAAADGGQAGACGHMENARRFVPLVVFKRDFF